MFGTNLSLALARPCLKSWPVGSQYLANGDVYYGLAFWSYVACNVSVMPGKIANIGMSAKMGMVSKSG